MGKILIEDVIKIMEDIAPIELAADFDNPGFLVGDKNSEVSGIVVALDCNRDTVEFAKNNGCNLIITHHPIIFHPISTVTTDTAVGSIVFELIKSGTALYSAHTNYDKTEGGTDDIFAEKIGFLETRRLDKEGFGRIGKLDITVGELKMRIKNNIGGKIISTANDDKLIHIAATCAGSGGSFANVALEQKAELFITGEMSYHEVLDAKRMGMDVLLCSHEASEQISMEMLKNTLQNRLNGVKYNIRVILAPFSPLWN